LCPFEVDSYNYQFTPFLYEVTHFNTFTEQNIM